MTSTWAWALTRSKILLGGCKTRVALLRRRQGIGRDRQLAGVQGGEDCVGHRDLPRFARDWRHASR